LEEKTENSQETEEEEPSTEEAETEAEVVKEEEAEIEEGTAEEEISEEKVFEKEEIEAPTRRAEEVEEFVEEKIYTIPLRRAWIMPPNKRAPKAVRIVKAFIQRHMKVGEVTVDEEGGRIIISNEVNEKIWSQGIEKPPRKLRIRAAKDEDGNVTIFLA
jgi:large subunit ribosomal protein L31e